ncbi:hypothetical protein [Cupriavidus sp. D384]|nr:hypothetical protein [Cupriavidus sp. D384]
MQRNADPRRKPETLMWSGFDVFVIATIRAGQTVAQDVPGQSSAAC